MDLERRVKDVLGALFGGGGATNNQSQSIINNVLAPGSLGQMSRK